ncbi:glutaredoxin domain-containing protein [uncultured Oceanicoccus sp.]|uniref:glutaredoxin domain-containing protein n=1 Tax=uncultured Oceanicoccus sp. TaxID=1706381 RepID=UPI0030D9E8F8
MNKKAKKILPLIVFISLFLITQNWWRIDLALNTIDVESLDKDDVVMYSTGWCPYCNKARLFFRQANILYTEYNVEKSASAYEEYSRISGLGVPVIVIGDQIIQGFDKSAIKQALTVLADQHNNDA